MKILHENFQLGRSVLITIRIWGNRKSIIFVIIWFILTKNSTLIVIVLIFCALLGNVTFPSPSKSEVSAVHCWPPWQKAASAKQNHSLLLYACSFQNPTYVYSRPFISTRLLHSFLQTSCAISNTGPIKSVCECLCIENHARDCKFKQLISRSTRFKEPRGSPPATTIPITELIMINLFRKGQLHLRFQSQWSFFNATAGTWEENLLLTGKGNL